MSPTLPPEIVFRKKVNRQSAASFDRHAHCGQPGNDGACEPDVVDPDDADIGRVVLSQFGHPSLDSERGRRDQPQKPQRSDAIQETIECGRARTSCVLDRRP